MKSICLVLFHLMIIVIFITACNKDKETCADGIQNQGELGIDCGGPCPACPTCNDGIQNGDETGIDCGGTCAACPISLSKDIMPIFNESCNESGCHATGDFAPNLLPGIAWNDLWTYSMVNTSDPSSSILFVRMNATSDPMPPTGRLAQDKLQLVLKWIEEGAKDN